MLAIQIRHMIGEGEAGKHVSHLIGQGVLAGQVSELIIIR